MATPDRGGARRKDRAREGKRGRANPQAGSASSGASYRWTRWIAYSALAVYALYWGVKAFSQHSMGNYAVETDFYWKYGPAARDLLHGRVSIENYDSKGWGYPAAVALLSLSGLDIFRAAQWIALLSAVLVGWLMYRLHQSLLGPGVALGSLLLLLTNKTFLANTYEVGTDMFFFAIVLASIALLMRRADPGGWRLLASGLLGGWAFSTRYNGLFLWPGALALLVLLPTAPGSPATRLRRFGVWTAGFLAGALPWLIVNAAHTGDPLTNSNYVNVGYTVYGEGNWEKFFYGGGEKKIRSFADIVRLDPGRFAGVMLKNSVDHIRRDLSDLLPLCWGILAVAGGLLLIAERAGRRVGGYLLLWALYFVTLIPVFYGARFSLPLLAPWLLLAAWPAVSSTLGKPIAALERSFPLRAFVFLALCLMTGFQAYQWTEDPKNNEQLSAAPYDLLPAVEFLSHNGAGETLIARKPHAAFLAKMRFLPIPEVDSPEALHEVATKAHARFLLVSRAEITRRAAALNPLLTKQGVPGFVPIFGSPGAIVFEVRPYDAGAHAP